MAEIRKIHTLLTGAAESAALLVAVAIAAVDNQGLANWRATQEGTGNGWLADVLKSTALSGWRFNPPSGHDNYEHWLSAVVFNVVIVLLTWFFAANTVRDHALGRFFGSWAGATLAGGGAGLAATALASAGSGLPQYAAYEQDLVTGLAFGFFVGVLAGLASFFAGRAGRKAEPAGNGSQSAGLPEPRHAAHGGAAEPEPTGATTTMTLPSAPAVSGSDAPGAKAE